jgi:hypothetical protein
VSLAPISPAEKRIRSAKRKYDLAGRLRDPRKLLAASSYYHKHLRPGEWTILSWPPPHKSRGFVAGWLDALKAARRILGIVTRQVKDEQGKPLKGKFRYYVRRETWPSVRARLGFVNSQPDASTESDELLGFKPLEEIKREREQFKRELDFIDALFSEITEQKFKCLPDGFRLTSQHEELATVLGPLFLERVKACLSEDYLRLGLPRRPRLEPAAAKKPATPKPPPVPKEPRAKEVVRYVKNRIRYGRL